MSIMAPRMPRRLSEMMSNGAPAPPGLRLVCPNASISASKVLISFWVAAAALPALTIFSWNSICSGSAKRDANMDSELPDVRLRNAGHLVRADPASHTLGRNLRMMKSEGSARNSSYSSCFIGSISMDWWLE